MSKSPIVGIVRLGAPPWPTLDPFLFCVHHDDAYPRGNETMGPVGSLAGRQIGMDFAGKDGWSMYHGDSVPGFPRHPHRGFETISIGRAGYIDHTDSLGARARFGKGDVQWMTAGSGIVHSEMFPLIEREQSNPTGLFQIWINLPAQDKMVSPYFTMMWRESIPIVELEDEQGRTTLVKVYAGALGDAPPPPPPPNSWASRPESGVAVWTIEVPPGARATLPGSPEGSLRTLYVVDGPGIHVHGQRVEARHAVQLSAGHELELEGGPGPTATELLLLQGRPIGEPVVQHGPFVMNSPREIEQAITDYRRTQYGGWPWKSDGPVHARQEPRFAVHADGREERPG